MLCRDLTRVLPQVDVVAFDYFNTLVGRHMQPEDVKKLAADRICSLFHNVHPNRYYRLRSRAERLLGASSPANEIAIRDVYATIYRSLGNAERRRWKGSEEEYVEHCVRTEVELERRVQFVKKDTLALLRTCHEAGKRVYVLSDFYMGREHIVELLEHHCLLRFFEDVVVSCDHQRNKRTGGLFRHVAEEVPPSRKLMIGDNYYSDYLNAKEAGWHALHIGDDVASPKPANDWFGRSADIRRELVARLEGGRFPEFGLSLYCFIDRLYHHAVADGAQTLLFQSREGQILKQLFELYQDQLGVQPTLRTEYLLVSRRSTFLPSLCALHDERFETLFRQYRSMSCLTFLQNMNLEDAQLLENLRLEGVDPHIVHDDFEHSAAFSELKANERFRRIYECNRRAQKGLLQRYVRSKKGSDDAVNLVDVGWKGTIQDHLFKAFDRQELVRGYYVGLLSNLLPAANNPKHGLLFARVPHKSDRWYVFAENTSLFEAMLPADHGSARSYVDNDGAVDVLLDEFEERSLYEDRMAAQAEFLKDRFQKVLSLLRFRPRQTYLSGLAAQRHARSVYLPTAQELAWYDELYHVENFGVYGRNDLGESKTCSTLRNLARLVRSPRRYLFGCLWPTQKLIRNNLTFLVPVYRLLRRFA